MSTRWLGIAMIIGTLAFIVQDLIYDVEMGNTSSRLALLLFCVGGICGVTGLIKLNALGSNTVARALGFVPMIGFAALALGAALKLSEVITLDDSLGNILPAIGWIMMLAGMLIVGILTIAARNWQGWRRFVPLLSILVIPVGLALGARLGNDDVGGAISFTGFLLLGIVIATFQSAPAPDGVVAA